MASPVKGRAILFAEMTPAPGDEARFNDWYDNHHTPSHVEGVPGFLSAHRYADPDGPGYCAVYELDSPEALLHPEYRSRKFTPNPRTKAMLDSVSGFTRYIGREIDYALRPGYGLEALDAEVLIAVFFVIPEDRRAEFVEWYRAEHTPMLLESADWRMVRHFDVVEREPEPFTHAMLHYVARREALEAPELAAARATPWRNRLAAEPWFKPHMVLYRKRGARFLKTGLAPATHPTGGKTG